MRSFLVSDAVSQSNEASAKVRFPYKPANKKMAIDWDLWIGIAKPFIGAAVGILVKGWAERRPRVVAFLQHASAVRLQAEGQPPVHVGTHSVVLRNGGRKAASNLRLGHNVLPAFQIAPDVHYQVRPLPSGGQEIVIPTLIPKKQIVITYLYVAPLTWGQVNTHLETDDGPVRVLDVLPTVRAPKWLISIIWALAGIGLVSLFYVGFQAAGWGTPTQ